jgi:hypothetical protein
VLIALSCTVAGAIRVGFVQAGLMDPSPLFPTAVEVDPGLRTFHDAVAIGILGGWSPGC